MDFVVKKADGLFGYEDNSDVALDPRVNSYPFFLSVAVSCICLHITPWIEDIFSISGHFQKRAADNAGIVFAFAIAAVVYAAAAAVVSAVVAAAVLLPLLF